MIFNSDIKLEADAEVLLFVFNENGYRSVFFINLEAVVVLFVFNENGSGSGFFNNLAVAEATKKCVSRLVFQ